MLRSFYKPALSLSLCCFTKHSRTITGTHPLKRHSQRSHSTATVERSVSNHTGRLRLVEDDYCRDHSTPFPPMVEQAMNELNVETINDYRNAHMMNSKTATLLLRQWISLFRPHRVLEIGTFTGYSTIAMASGLGPDSHLISLEKDPAPLLLAERYLARAGLSDKVTFLQGDALESLLTLAKDQVQFDVIFLDADKGGYIKYYDTILDNNMLSDNGTLLVDNVLYFGQVHRVAGYHEDQPTPASKNINRVARKLDAFNKHVKQDERVQSVILPLFDGLTVIKKK
ncbi:O-methyltransferase-domain-containing protein [Chlamydoabsidia padenii]|nr:O-methyltransferase-domain-containing protein [Chlamydoabsidia padenii]